MFSMAKATFKGDSIPRIPEILALFDLDLGRFSCEWWIERHGGADGQVDGRFKPTLYSVDDVDNG